MLEHAIRDQQTVAADGISTERLIDGVVVVARRNVLTRSGALLEVYRRDWPSVSAAPGQVNWVMLMPAGVTDWHRHLKQTDHIFAVSGLIKLCLHDDRSDSPTRGLSNVLRIGDLNPQLVVVPPGVWHAFRNESGAPAGFINYFEHPFDHAEPDNWRLPHDSPTIPCRL